MNACGIVLHDFAMEQLPKRNRWTLEDLRLAYPFHRLLFSEEAILGARVERSVVTSMGTGTLSFNRENSSRGQI